MLLKSMRHHQDRFYFEIYFSIIRYILGRCSYSAIRALVAMHHFIFNGTEITVK